MDDLARKLRKIKEYTTPTKSGYVLTNFQSLTNYHDGSTSFRLHFRRAKNLQRVSDRNPLSFDVSIQYVDNFEVDLKNWGNDTERLYFSDSQSVVEYLTAK
ncbi:hypothetical protein GCM10023189_11130 [Nibrella saemangeumensis]|uniref:Uncharacterized protein n=1 Tax=Nibrella saemangeumensis TaxID=1084526 RepID=A0ABP8MK17_9BACT